MKNLIYYVLKEYCKYIKLIYLFSMIHTKILPYKVYLNGTAKFVQKIISHI